MMTSSSIFGKNIDSNSRTDRFSGSWAFHHYAYAEPTLEFGLGYNTMQFFNIGLTFGIHNISTYYKEDLQFEVTLKADSSALNFTPGVFYAYSALLLGFDKSSESGFLDGRFGAQMRLSEQFNAMFKFGVGLRQGFSSGAHLALSPFLEMSANIL